MLSRAWWLWWNWGGRNQQQPKVWICSTALFLRPSLWFLCSFNGLRVWNINLTYEENQVRLEELVPVHSSAHIGCFHIDFSCNEKCILPWGFTNDFRAAEKLFIEHIWQSSSFFFFFFRLAEWRFFFARGSIISNCWKSSWRIFSLIV